MTDAVKMKGGLTARDARRIADAYGQLAQAFYDVGNQKDYHHYQRLCAHYTEVAKSIEAQP